MKMNFLEKLKFLEKASPFIFHFQSALMKQSMPLTFKSTLRDVLILVYVTLLKNGAEQ